MPICKWRTRFAGANNASIEMRYGLEKLANWSHVLECLLIHLKQNHQGRCLFLI